MRPVGETLGEGIEEQDEKGERCKPKGKRIELPGSEEKYRNGCEREEPREAGGERAGGQGTLRGAGIILVVAQVGDAVDGHGGATRGNHSYNDPEKLLPGRPVVGSETRGEQCARERKRQSKNGVLEFDHF
jgi:hypothetical protein